MRCPSLRPWDDQDSIPGLGQHGGELWLSLINYKPGFLDTTRRSSLMPVLASSIVARILPIVCRRLEGVSPPRPMRDRNYIFF
jgi:hypothetical protein